MLSPNEHGELCVSGYSSNPIMNFTFNHGVKRDLFMTGQFIFALFDALHVVYPCISLVQKQLSGLKES